MDALNRAVLIVGSQARLAAELGVRQQNIWNWLNRPRAGAPVECCADIERVTGYLVRRWELRPDDWHRIWPELVGTEGAPDVPVALT